MLLPLRPCPKEHFQSCTKTLHVVVCQYSTCILFMPWIHLYIGGHNVHCTVLTKSYNTQAYNFIHMKHVTEEILCLLSGAISPPRWLTVRSTPSHQTLQPPSPLQPHQPAPAQNCSHCQGQQATPLQQTQQPGDRL